MKSFLTSSASSVLSGLTLTENNYKEAVILLKQRYSNEQVLVSAYMRRFVQLPKIKSMNDIQGLRSLYDQVESSIRNLNSLNKTTDSYGTLLVPLLNDKLPTDLSVILARKFDNEIWTLDEML